MSTRTKIIFVSKTDRFYQDETDRIIFFEVVGDTVNNKKEPRIFKEELFDKQY